MDINGIRIAVEVLSFVAFIGIVLWAWNPRRRSALDQVARSVLED